MTHAISETDSLSNFTTNPAPVLEKLRRSGEPLLLMIEGSEGIIVQDAAAYQRMLATVERLETLAAIKEGLQDVAQGRTRPIREALTALAHKHSLPAVTVSVSEAEADTRKPSRPDRERR